MEIKTIVITGGPCAGKTSAMQWIKRDIEKLGYRVLIIPETATELIGGGVCPWTCGTNMEYQKVQMHLQREKERSFLQAAKTMASQTDKILIVCDRGQFDNMVYMTKNEFSDILDYMGTYEEEVLSAYNAVFHLVSSAIGTDVYTTNLNNAARYEGKEQSIIMDEKFIQAWGPHPEHYMVCSNNDFDKKMKSLINGISDFLVGDVIYPDVERPEYIAPFYSGDAWEIEQEYPEI